MLFYQRKHRPFEALGAGVPSGHPLASASCSDEMLTIVTATTPNKASADTIAITTNVVLSIGNPEKYAIL